MEEPRDGRHGVKCKLPAFNCVALVDFGGAGGHFVGLVSLDQIFNVFVVLVIYPAGEDIDVG